VVVFTFEATIANIIFRYIKNILVGLMIIHVLHVIFSEAALSCFSSISVSVNNLFFLFSVFIFYTFFLKKNSLE
jgi:hypothetical protein